MTVRNSIVANQTTGIDCAVQSGGSIVAAANNLDSDGTCDGATTGNAGLEPLANNGGPTQTHALALTSDALDTGDDSICTSPSSSPTFGAGGVDQRGVSRPQGLQCDLGAYERLNLDIDDDGVLNAADNCPGTPADQRPVTAKGCSEQQLGLVRPGACLQGPNAYTVLIVGSNGANNIVVPAGVNAVVYGLGGNDNITDGSGISCLVGGPGNDNLKGGNGIDVLVGGTGTDKGLGGAGFDRCGLDVEVRTECEATF
jgi:hypothetical protein